MLELLKPLFGRNGRVTDVGDDPLPKEATRLAPAAPPTKPDPLAVAFGERASDDSERR